jgi:predicted transposase YbfD/YdcC
VAAIAATGNTTFLNPQLGDFMAQENRLTRRLVGMVRARLPDVRFADVADPRGRRGRRWPLVALLNAALLGLMAGARDLQRVEALTTEMSAALRRQLGIHRRVADTTLRDALCRLDLGDLRQCMVALVRRAYRRKALSPVNFPFGVVAIDGKATALNCAPGPFAQAQDSTSKLTVIRTQTCTLISSAAKVCLDAMPITATTNEMGHFATTLRELCRTYAGLSLFQVVTSDAGACSLHNANVVRELSLDYLFAIKETQPTLLTEAKRLLAHLTKAQAIATTDEARGGGSWVRRVYVTSEMQGYLEWSHLQTVLRIESERLDAKGNRISYEQRYYVSSLPRERLTDAQWLAIVRAHWGVENGTHHTLDAVFREDDHPWIESNENGMLVVAILRRIALNLMALFRSVTQRSEDKRATPWRDLIRWFYNALIVATDATLIGLRPRSELPVCS